MTNDIIEAATGKGGPLATAERGERTLTRLLGTREAREILRRAREEAAIEAEDTLTQAEEANAIDPVG
jgi:hypothetical protein